MGPWKGVEFLGVCLTIYGITKNKATRGANPTTRVSRSFEICSSEDPLGSAYPLVVWETNILVRTMIPHLSNNTMMLILLLIFLDFLSANDELTAQPRIRTLVPFDSKLPVILYAYIQPIAAQSLTQHIQYTYYARLATGGNDTVGDHSW
jgi:hypothetical protein